MYSSCQQFTADTLPRFAAAGAGLLLVRKIVFLAGDGEFVELIGAQVPPPTLHPANGLHFDMAEINFGRHII